MMLTISESRRSWVLTNMHREQHGGDGALDDAAATAEGFGELGADELFDGVDHASSS